MVVLSVCGLLLSCVTMINKTKPRKLIFFLLSFNPIYSARNGKVRDVKSKIAAARTTQKNVDNSNSCVCVCVCTANNSNCHAVLLRWASKFAKICSRAAEECNVMENQNCLCLLQTTEIRAAMLSFTNEWLMNWCTELNLADACSTSETSHQKK